MDFADVFLSHHVSSMNNSALKLEKELQSMGLQTFICTRIKPGCDYRQSIVTNAVKCKVFVAFVNEAWAQSDECMIEFNCALSNYNAHKTPKILPIIIGGFNWIDVVKYPHVFNIKANTNCAVLDGKNWNEVLEEVTATIESILNLDTFDEKRVRRTGIDMLDNVIG